MSSASDFYRTGQQDCQNTFDDETFENIDVTRLVMTVERAERREANKRHPVTTYALATAAALRALRRADWPTTREWLKSIDYDPNEDGPISEAFDAWQRGFMECAVPRLRSWILNDLREHRTLTGRKQRR